MPGISFGVSIHRFHPDAVLATFTIQAATSWLDTAEAAITGFLQTSQSERVAVAILTLTRSR